MLKKLQRKFVLLTTAISVIVLVIIAVLVNVTNYFSMINHAQDVLNLLISGELSMYENSGFYGTDGQNGTGGQGGGYGQGGGQGNGGENFGGNANENSDKDYADGENDNTAPPPPQRSNFAKEIAFTTRYFVVRSNAQGEFNYVDTKNISYISPEDALNFAMQVDDSNKLNGTIEDFKYSKVENPIGYSYYFLDIEEDVISFELYVRFSAFIALGASVVIFALSCIFSKKAVAPIAQSYERQKAFITDVSHEFKTPLTIIKADSEVIELENGESEWTSSINTQVKRLNTLVENLVSLTKLDEQQENVVKTNINLSKLVSSTLNEFSPTMHSHNLTLNTSIKSEIFINGDEKSIYNLLSILLENAVKYAPKNSEVFASVYEKSNKKIFKIENSCDSLKIGKHNEFFDRFYRNDKVRNSESKGFGIGLSIAKSICEMHGAKITAESKTGSEIIFTVIF